MRSLSAAALARLTQSKGTAPYNIIAVAWGGKTLYYCDKKTDFAPGKILSLGNLENIVSLDRSTTTVSLTVKLDDTDGSLKQIINNVDIHKKKVWVFQWYDDLPFDDRFLLFFGEIASPIIWEEGQRTLTFNVTSRMYDKEVGYSIEEGEYEGFDDELVGKPWPLVFGSTLKVPALQLDKIPNLVTVTYTGVIDPTLIIKLSDLYTQSVELDRQARVLYAYGVAAQIMASQAYFQAENAAGADEAEAYIQLAEEYDSIAEQMFQAATELLNQKQQVDEEYFSLALELENQKKNSRDSVEVDTDEFVPQGPFRVKMGSCVFDGSFVNERFNITNKIHPVNIDKILPDGTVIEKELEVTWDQEKQKFVMSNDAGGFALVSSDTQIIILSEYRIRYVCNLIESTETTVWAKKNDKFTVVPANYYEVKTLTAGIYTSTIIEMKRPLSWREDGWSDEIFVDVKSSVGPNTIDILTWLLNTYTDLSVDVSFAYVKGILESYPSNFVLQERENILKVVQDIAFQARCATWINNDKIHIKYLPNDPVADETLTLDDIDFGTMRVGFDPSENLITKLVATYRRDYAQEKPNKIIVKNNVSKYGLKTKEVDWYIYSNPNIVLKAATFWIIRLSNSWKHLLCSVSLNKLRIENFDGVSLSFVTDYIANTNVTGIVEKSIYDSENNTIELDIWLPIRLGEMTKYNFAFPAEVIFTYPSEREKKDREAGGDGPNSDQKVTLPKYVNNFKARKFSLLEREQPIEDGDKNPGDDNNDDDQYDDWTPREREGSPPVTTYNFNKYDKVSVEPDDVFGRLLDSKPLPGIITEIVANDEYVVRVYPGGIIDDDNSKLVKVKQLQIAQQAQFDLYTWVTVIENRFRKENEDGTVSIVINYYIQEAIWL